MRISSPPMRFLLHGRRHRLHRRSSSPRVARSEEVRAKIGADSLAYLSIPGLMRAIGRGTSQEFCRACFDGSSPVPVPQQARDGQDAVRAAARSDHVPGPPSPQLVRPTRVPMLLAGPPATPLHPSRGPSVRRDRVDIEARRALERASTTRRRGRCPRSLMV